MHWSPLDDALTLAGQWPEWCAGVRVSPPFAAHAWVRAEGRDVGEPHPEGYYRAMVSVPAVTVRLVFGRHSSCT